MFFDRDAEPLEFQRSSVEHGTRQFARRRRHRVDHLVSAGVLERRRRMTPFSSRIAVQSG